MLILISACSSGNVKDGFEFKETIKVSDEVNIGDLNKNQWKLELDKDSFMDEVELTMRIVSETERTELETDNFKLLSAPIEFNVSEQTNVRLQNSGHVTVKIPDSYTNEGTYENLFIGYLAESGWEFFLPDTIDLEKNTVNFTIYHFSTYAFGEPSEDEQIKTLAKRIATETWMKQNQNTSLMDATQNQFDTLFKEIGMTGSSAERNTLTADAISFLEDSFIDSGKTSPLDALVQMGNAANQDEAGKQAFTEKYIEFMGKAIMHVIERDPEAFASQFNYSVVLTKIALAVKDGDDEEALKGIGSLLKVAVPQAQIVESTLLYVVEKSKQSIDYWTAGEIEKAYKAYIGEANGKYGFTDSRDFDLIFTTLGGGQRLTELKIIEKWCADRKINPDSLGQAGKDAIVNDAYTALKAHFDLRKVQEPAIKELQAQEELFIEALRHEGLTSPKNYTTFFQSEGIYNPTLRLQQLYQIKDFVLNMIDPEIAKTLTPTQIAIIIRQWVHFNDRKDRKAFYDYLKASNYIKVIPKNPDFAWVLVDTVTYDGSVQIAATNANGVYSALGSTSPGSYSYTWSYLGSSDTYYDPDLLNGEGATILGNNSTPASIIKGEELVSLTLNLSIGSDNLSYFTADGAISADIDNWDVAPGFSTNAYEDFVNKDNKSSFIVSTYKTIQLTTISETVTATMPNGANEGDKIAIRVSFNSSAIMGTHYIYEWKPVG